MRLASRVSEPAPPAPKDGGGGGGWRWLLTAQGIIEAELIKGLLEQSGVLPVALDAHDPGPGAWMFPAGNVNALVRVYVQASQLEAARLVLLETGLDMPALPRSDVSQAWPIARVLWTALTLLVLVGVVLFQLRGLFR